MRSFIALIGVALFSTSSMASTNDIVLGSMGSPHTSITSSVAPKSVTKKMKISQANYETKAYTTTKHSAGPRPGRWCGWWMRTQFGGGSEYNLARNWAKRGSSAGGPRVGAVVVWAHHVGYITGRASNGKWIVKSGNDGGRVRERARSVSGAIAFRMI